MIQVSDERFEELVDLGLDQIPEKFVRHMNNTVILIGTYHPESPYILGFYEGVALPERTFSNSGHLPDAITIYKNALEDMCSTEEELIEQVKITVIHEVGHHFGLDDDDLHALGWG